jgi:hypothetical protein
MEYCELHKDLNDEEGDNCPLCECMNEKAETVGRLGIRLSNLQDLLQKSVKLLRNIAWRSKIHLSGCNCTECNEIDKLLDHPEIKNIMKGK